MCDVVDLRGVVAIERKPTLRGASQAAWLRRLHLILFPQRFAHVADPTKHVLAANPRILVPMFRSRFRIAIDAAAPIVRSGASPVPWLLSDAWIADTLT
jgi:hypothetical protein